jgi:two-component system, OmpR family, response regulator CpxR
MSGHAVRPDREEDGLRATLTAKAAISVLLIEDDAELSSLMTEFFVEHGFQIEAVSDGLQGLYRSLEGDSDIIILDVMLPSMNGFEVLRQLRKRSAKPVILLTARTRTEDRITGLDIGADDYLLKPFEPDELLARIRAVLRRTGKEGLKTEVVQAGDLTLNAATREVHLGGEAIDLTWVEFDILEALARAAGRVVSRNELAAILYQRDATPYERSLDVHISHLRRKLERDGRRLIRSVRTAGYVLSPGK